MAEFKVFETGIGFLGATRTLNGAILLLLGRKGVITNQRREVVAEVK